MSALDEYERIKAELGDCAVSNQADAAIKELEATIGELERFAAAYIREATDQIEAMLNALEQRQRAEQAEADLAAMTKERDEEKDYIHQLEGWLAQVRERSASLLEERNALTEERDRARDQRCRDCEHWDREHAETVANVAFAYCDNKIATKEFKSSVMSEGWLCPLLARYQPAEEER